MKYLKTLILISVTLMVSGVVSVAEEVEKEAPYISYNWQNITSNKTSCLDDAKASMEETGFSVLTRQSKSLVVGTSEEYKGTIVCLPSRKMAFFVVSGADFNEAKRLTDKLKSNFK